MFLYAETTIPSLSVEQTSQTSVDVTFEIDDSRCVSTYHVNVTYEGGTTTTMTGPASPVTVMNLDICRYNYSFVGYTTSMTGEQSATSAVSDFMFNISSNITEPYSLS